MSHIPGPWKVADGGFVDGPNGGRVCQLWNKFEEDFTNAEDNAPLIAAAPELLTMLRDAAAMARGCQAYTAGTPSEDFFRRKAYSWERAIAKAEGRA